jgi:putative peptide zinc metalloprotease protein
MWLLIVYGLFSFPYRIVVVATIVLVLWSSPKYLTIGAVIAVVAGVAWILWPILKGIGYLLTSPQLLGRRARAIAIAGGAVLLVGGFVAAVPMPAAGYASGTVEPFAAEPIRPTEEGFVQTVHVRAGDFVNVGDPLVTLHNAEIMANLGAAQAQLLGAQADVDASIAGPLFSRVQAEARLKQAESNLMRAQERADSLVVRATTTGRVVLAPGTGTDLDHLLGQFIQKGTLLGTVATMDQLIVRCVVADRDRGYIFRAGMGNEPRGAEASVRVRGSAGDVVDGQVIRASQSGSRRVTEESLTTAAGGEVIVDPNDPKKETTVSPQWLVEVSPRATSQQQMESWKPGLRARVRFAVHPEPLARQWWRRFSQYLQDKASV